MKIGEIIASDGKQRKIIGFCTSEGAEQPITEPYNEEKANDGELIINENKVVETGGNSETENTPTATIKYSCKFCGKELKNQNSFEAHERMCSKNPDSRNYKGE